MTLAQETDITEEQKSAAPATGADNADAQGKNQSKVDYSVSGGLVALLTRHNISIAITSYQSGLLYLIGRNKDNGINIHQAAMPKPMGLHFDAKNGLVMSANHQILRFDNVLNEGQAINHMFDTCYVPRTVHVTGRLDAHDIGVDADGEIYFVNTRFNCIATLSNRHSFKTYWKPSFISEVVDEDRCHLNGMAMENGRPKYATAVSRSNTIDGWRDRRADGGVVIDIESGEIICEGLSMPHSPRIHDGKLWLLNSGTGELGYVEMPDGKSGTKKMGKFVPKAFCPGFVRGLRFIGNMAFVGLSKPRYKRFEGLALDDRLKEADSEAWCGVQVIDLETGRCVDWFRIDGAIGELYDVEILPQTRIPMAASPFSDESANLITFE